MAINQIDSERVQKGVVFSAEELETILEEKQGTDKYRLKLLGLKCSMEKIQGLLGRPVVFKSEHNNLRVLMDNEASDYSDWRYEIGLSSAFRNNKRLASVDISNLSPAETTKHERRLYTQSKELQGLRRIRKDLFLEPHQRSTPTMDVDKFNGKPLVENSTIDHYTD